MSSCQSETSFQFSTSFHKRKYCKEDWHSDWNIWEASYLQKIKLQKTAKEKRSTALLIDSLYKNTNYFTEVISECSYYRNRGNKVIMNHIDSAINHKDKKESIYKLLSLIMLIIIGSILLYIKSKK